MSVTNRKNMIFKSTSKTNIDSVNVKREENQPAPVLNTLNSEKSIDVVRYAQPKTKTNLRKTSKATEMFQTY